MHTAPTITRLPAATSDAAPQHDLAVLFRKPWFRHAAWGFVAAAFIASATGCGRETVSPVSDELMIVFVAGADLFELDSVQLAAAISGTARLPAEAVTWSVSDGELARVSATGLVTAIRATDFDRPADPLG